MDLGIVSVGRGVEEGERRGGPGHQPGMRPADGDALVDRSR
jgi:hypothetical protein